MHWLTDKETLLRNRKSSPQPLRAKPMECFSGYPSLQRALRELQLAKSNSFWNATKEALRGLWGNLIEHWGVSRWKGQTYFNMDCNSTQTPQAQVTGRRTRAPYTGWRKRDYHIQLPPKHHQDFDSSCTSINYRIKPMESHAELATLCVIYLSLDEFDSQQFPLDKLDGHKLVLWDLLEKYLFLSYSAVCWPVTFGI
jgi:hypothetical protein